MYGVIGMSASSLHRESTDSLIWFNPSLISSKRSRRSSLGKLFGRRHRKKSSGQKHGFKRFSEPLPRLGTYMYIYMSAYMHAYSVYTPMYILVSLRPIFIFLVCDVHICVPLFVWVGITFLPLYSLASVLCTCTC